MQDQAGVDQKMSVAELIALVRKIREEIEAHGELNELNLLLRDFTLNLLKKRLLQRVEFIQMMESSRPHSTTPVASETSYGQNSAP
jgi:hypothetical protein